MPRGGHDIPVSGTHLKGTHEVVTKGVDPTDLVFERYKDIKSVKMEKSNSNN